jgi:hypothetical protein
MIRWSVIAAGVAIVAGTAFVASASVSPKPHDQLPDPQELKVVATLGQNTGYFNMARLMLEYQRAQSAVSRFNVRKDRLSANLAGLRAMYNDLPRRARSGAGQSGVLPAKFEVKPDGTLQTIREDGPDPFSPDAVLLTRRIQDLELEINKLTNNQAAIIIVELYDEIHATVVELAHEHNLVAVLAFPDARTPEEMDSSQTKELKLKPPAAQPFYIDPSVDYTDELIERLNAKFATQNGRK